LWQEGRRFRNLFLVLVPAGFFVYGIILTHSRGALIGLVALVVAAFGGRLGRIGRTTLLVIGLMLVLFLNKGQREVSANEGSAAGRLEAWGTGISMLESYPIFGTGYGTFTQYNELTAHNSFVLCFAELGLFGYFCWLGLIISTTKQLNAITASDSKVNYDVAFACQILKVSLFAFLATSWFLSRTYVVTLYMLLGMAVSLIAIASEAPQSEEQEEGEERSGLDAERDQGDDMEDGGPEDYWELPWPKTTAIIELASIILVYGFVRARGL
jgi:O-antigen ligase